MRPLLFYFASLLVLAPSASAQIGETPQQCTARYGAPIQSEPNAMMFTASGLTVAIVFHEDKAESATFQRTKPALAQDEELSDEEILHLLQANVGGSGWVKLGMTSDERSWHTLDDQLLALYDLKARELLITTRKGVKRQAEQSKEDTRK